MWDYFSSNTWPWVITIVLVTVIIGAIIFDNIINNKKKAK